MEHIVETIGFNDGLPHEAGRWPSLEEALDVLRVLKEQYPLVSHRVIIVLEQTEKE